MDAKKEIGEAVIRGEMPHLSPSKQDWDWLGEGVYFWESDPVRGFEWATDKYGYNAFVVGAVIHLGNSLDLMSRRATTALRAAYDSFVLHHHKNFFGKPLPQNTKEGFVRRLDCAVINHLHKVRDEFRPSPLPEFNTVRGLFQEGKPAFDGSEILSKNHIQICVRTPASIKGYFRVPEEHLR